MGGTPRRLVPAPVRRTLRPVRAGLRAAELGVRIRARPAPWSEMAALVGEPVQVGELRAPIERLLVENIVPFWLPGTIDERGGYLLNHDVVGRPQAPSGQRLVSQCRMVWFYSRLARSPYGSDEHLGAARHGFDHLVDVFLDRKEGGYHWAVDETGCPVGDHPVGGTDILVKDVCGQSYALYALSEFALASGSADAERHARELFAVLEEQARDPLWGGYFEVLDRDWAPLRHGLDHHVDLICKTFPVQVHMLEALAPFVELTGDPTARAALEELLDRASTSMIFRPVGIGVSVLTRDWQPVLGDRANVHVYGHDLELVALAHDARRALGLPVDRLAPEFRDLFANAVARGMDRRAGGFYLRGEVGRPPHDHGKPAWVQAEALGTAVELYALTGEAEFAAVAGRTVDWVVGHQADWVAGDWHALVHPDGTVSGMKADGWKAAYHNGRAVLRALDLLPG